MEKKSKKGIIIGIASVLVVAAVIVSVILLNKKDAYRIIKIYEVDGVSTVTRKDIGELEPYNNMVLESGDNIFHKSGKMTLKMDDDKYAYVEENTEFTLIAEGTSANSRTTIELKNGAITNEIQNKLSDEASYEINTPNSTMAVRGTIYRVEIYYDEDGKCYTKVSVFQGCVATRLVYPDGSISEEEVSVEAGKEVIIYEDGKTTDYLGDVRDIDYSELPECVLELLLELNANGQDINVGVEILEYYLNPGPFTVTFIYNGNVFGVQVVEKGECAAVPTLLPAPSGEWNFDFSTPIYGDTEIEWQ